jgi:hypothetical protein
VIVLVATPSRSTAQVDAQARDSNRVLLLEHQFGPDSVEPVVVMLERKVVYWAEVTGADTLVVQPTRRRGRPAFLVPIASDSGPGFQRYEVYALQTGPHAITLSQRTPGTTATLRLYRDVAETRRIVQKLDRGVAFGFAFAAGVHTGYRLDPTGGANPRGGRDVEGCLMVETGDRFGTCFGFGRQSFPDAGYSATWLFFEERGRLVSHRTFGGRRADLGASLRFSHGLGVGPRTLTPGILGVGLYLTQRFALEEHRRGWQVSFSWQHGWLGFAPETELLEVDRFTAGVAWVP